MYNNNNNTTPSTSPIPTHQVLMTLIASVSILMSSKHRRWMSLRETLSVQGFPMDSQFTHQHPCSSYALRQWFESCNVTPPSSWPSRRAACHQAGNSMHVAISGIVMLFAMTQIQIDPDVFRLVKFVHDREAILPKGHTAIASSPNKRKHQ